MLTVEIDFDRPAREHEINEGTKETGKCCVVTVFQTLPVMEKSNWKRGHVLRQSINEGNLF